MVKSFRKDDYAFDDGFAKIGIDATVQVQYIIDLVGLGGREERGRICRSLNANGQIAYPFVFFQDLVEGSTGGSAINGFS